MWILHQCIQCVICMHHHICLSSFSPVHLVGGLPMMPLLISAAWSPTPPHNAHRTVCSSLMVLTLPAVYIATTACPPDHPFTLPPIQTPISTMCRVLSAEGMAGFYHKHTKPHVGVLFHFPPNRMKLLLLKVQYSLSFKISHSSMYMRRGVLNKTFLWFLINFSSFIS